MKNKEPQHMKHKAKTKLSHLMKEKRKKKKPTQA
jgi:hypothetical protein